MKGKCVENVRVMIQITFFFFFFTFFFFHILLLLTAQISRETHGSKKWGIWEAPSREMNMSHEKSEHKKLISLQNKNWIEK